MDSLSLSLALSYFHVHAHVLPSLEIPPLAGICLHQLTVEGAHISKLQTPKFCRLTGLCSSDIGAKSFDVETFRFHSNQPRPHFVSCWFRCVPLVEKNKK